MMGQTPKLKHPVWLLLCALCAACSLSKEETNEPPAELVEFEPTIRVKQLWQQRIGDGWENLRLGLVPTDDGTYVYAASHDGQVQSIDLANGRSRWRTKTKLPLAAGPSVSDNTVVLGSSDGDVIALNARDGEELWRINVAGEVLAAPVITRGLAIVRTVNGRIKALNLSTGVERWESEFELPRLTLRGNSPPVVSGDLVISGMDNGRVVALDVNDGSRVWESILTLPSGRTDLELLSDVDAAIRVIGERLFVVGYQGRIGMLSRDSGQVLWSHDLSSYAGMGADWTRLYITDSDSEVVALDQNTGSTLWRQNAMRARWLTAPTSIGRNIVVGDFEGYLHWLNGDTGDLVARSRVGKEALINPAQVAGETLLVLSSDSKLVAYQVIPPKVE